MDGLPASKEILSQYPQARILLLTTFLDDEYIIQALKLGAKGYLLKQDYNSIIPALKAVYSGQSVYGSEITAKLPGLLTSQKSFPWEEHHIGPRELEVIDLVAQGLSNKEIAGKLYLSEGTVRNYLSIILEKLDFGTGPSWQFFICEVDGPFKDFQKSLLIEDGHGEKPLKKFPVLHYKKDWKMSSSSTNTFFRL